MKHEAMLKQASTTEGSKKKKGKKNEEKKDKKKEEEEEEKVEEGAEETTSVPEIPNIDQSDMCIDLKSPAMSSKPHTRHNASVQQQALSV